jgi:hypothetical protein
MGKPESEEAEGCREQGGPRVVPSFDGDPAPWDFGAFGRRLADILAAAVRKVGVKRRSKPG